MPSGKGTYGKKLGRPPKKPKGGKKKQNESYSQTTISSCYFFKDNTYKITKAKYATTDRNWGYDLDKGKTLSQWSEKS